VAGHDGDDSSAARFRVIIPGQTDDAVLALV